MILVDTSIWVDHLRKGVPKLVDLLEQGLVFMHPFVLGEVACGHLKNRGELLRLLRGLPQISVVTESEALAFLENHGLMGRGIGYVDLHLLAAVTLDGAARLWTADKHLTKVAEEMKLDFVAG